MISLSYDYAYSATTAATDTDTAADSAASCWAGSTLDSDSA